MRAFFLGDLQAHAWSQYSNPRADGLNDRLLDVVNELRRIRRLAIKRQMNAVFILGDVFQERGKLDLTVLNSIYREVDQFRRRSIEVLMLVGNHDRAPVGAFHSLEVFKRIATVVDRPTQVMIGGMRVGAIPFFAEASKTVDYLQQYANSEILILHTAVRNIKLASGEMWGDGIALSDIPEKPWTFMGHYHKFTKLRDRCFYVGSLLQNNWGERDPKVFAQFVDGRVTWVPTQGPIFVEVTAEDFHTRTDLKGNFVRVHWTGPLDETGAVRSYLMDTVGARAVDFTFPTSDFKTEMIERLSTDPRVTALLQSYVQMAPITDRGSLLKIGQLLMTEAERQHEDHAEED
jgi:DNA repair exonuclease SbcCD nuclease subunit